jgi:hypothetical protein
MNEDQLRSLVRDVVSRHLEREGLGRPAPDAPSSWKAHPSHFLLPVLNGRQGDGPCLIEPAVTCHHCGYCQSFGH